MSPACYFELLIENLPLSVMQFVEQPPSAVEVIATEGVTASVTGVGVSVTGIGVLVTGVGVLVIGASVSV